MQYYVQLHLFIFFPFVSGRINIPKRAPAVQTPENIQKQEYIPNASDIKGNAFTAPNDTILTNVKQKMDPISRICKTKKIYKLISV